MANLINSINATIGGQFGEYSLYDSETTSRVSADELDLDADGYEEAIRESYAQGTAEGHIEVNGRKVYASTY